MKRLWRYSPWLPRRRQEVAAIVVDIAVVAALLAALTKFQNFGETSNLGFGPDWDCAYTPNSESVCVKRVPPPSPPTTAPAN
jgi:hypothetical protein